MPIDKERIASQIQDIHTWTREMRTNSFVADQWTTIQPLLPTQDPEETQLTVDFWKIRNLGLNMAFGVAEIVWFSGFYYAHFTSKHEGPVANQTRFQIRNGKFYGRDSNGSWNNESTGWEYSGIVMFPDDGADD